jgi:hypothetical protein
MEYPVDLGHDHRLIYHSWAPDRDLNPQYESVADIDKFGAAIEHPHAVTGERCVGGITFDTPEVQRVLTISRSYGGVNGAVWQVQSWDPLTISPSILCSCGDHGFIRNGRWEPA